MLSHRRTIFCFALMSFLLTSATSADDKKRDGKHNKDHEIVTPTDMKWQEGPASLQKGAQYVILDGDPSQDGPFVIRIKLPDGFRVMPHTHPKDERVTVITGTLYLGMGAKYDEQLGVALPAGSYGRTNAGMKHFGWVKGETILQLHGTGPWAVEYLNPEDDPRGKK